MATTPSPSERMDWSQKLSDSAKRRPHNNLKKLCAPFLHSKGIVLLGGGLPNPNSFPFLSISAEFRDGTKVKISEKQDQKYNFMLQYNGTGVKPWKLWLKKFMKKYVKPYGDTWDVCPTAGSSDGLEKVFSLLTNPGDIYLTESHTYAAALSNIRGQGGTAHGVDSDDQGILPDVLENEIQNLKDQKKNIKGIYVVPVGANPSGTVMSKQRCTEIYAIAKKYGLFIIEDAAYDWLQYSGDRKIQQVPGLRFGGFLPMDTDGRVLRLDTVSKFLAPGLRSGWMTGSPGFLSHFQKLSALSTHSGSAINQSIVFNLLAEWGDQGLQDHVIKLQTKYQERRNIVYDACQEHLKGLAVWKLPTAGMFFWIRECGSKDTSTAISSLIKHGVLVVPGEIFKADEQDPKSPYFRLSFSYASAEDLVLGVQKLAKVLQSRRDTSDKDELDASVQVE